MPDVAIYNKKLIHIEDLYKFNIDKQSEFICACCNNSLKIKECRNGEHYFKTHFFHPNTVKGTSISCDDYHIKKNMGEWHTMMSEALNIFSSEICRFEGSNKHILDGYDPETELGIEFQNSKISTEDIISREELTNIDWIFNVSDQYTRKVRIGYKNMAICEIPHENWEQAIKVCKNNVFLFTGKSEYIWITDTNSYRIEIEGKKRHVWISEYCSLSDVIENTCLENIITPEGREKLERYNINMEQVDIIYGRCKKSMILLDDIHRHYITNHKFNTNETIAIKSVAGSGKTTTLMEIAKKNSSKKILYLAFNKSLIEEIGEKVKKQSLNNLHPKTFDSMIYYAYIHKTGNPPNSIIELKPHNVHNYVPWLANKAFGLKKKIINDFSKFCRQEEYNCIKEYNKEVLGGEKPLLEKLWYKALNKQLLTFETLRKMCQIESWSSKYINNVYDMILIDEAQDFDSIMMSILQNDTTIPKIYVGDPMQSIYKWRGSINAFKRIPEDSLIVEFYSTFRIGDPACDEISRKFKNCWMISKSKNNTKFVSNFSKEINKYVYLFRSWKCLLQSAEYIPNVWIFNFHAKIQQIEKLYYHIQKYPLSEEERDQYEDDLPNFLLELEEYELQRMITNIKSNLVEKEESNVQLYTIHSYKGLEHDYIKLGYDIDESDQCLYYVALTRGKKLICY